MNFLNMPALLLCLFALLPNKAFAMIICEREIYGAVTATDIFVAKVQGLAFEGDVKISRGRGEYPQEVKLLLKPTKTFYGVSFEEYEIREQGIICSPVHTGSYIKNIQNYRENEDGRISYPKIGDEVIVLGGNGDQLCHDHLIIKGENFLKWDEVKAFVNCVSLLKKQNHKLKRLEGVSGIFSIRSNSDHTNLLDEITKACPLPTQESQTSILDIFDRFLAVVHIE